MPHDPANKIKIQERKSEYFFCCLLGGQPPARPAKKFSLFSPSAGRLRAPPAGPAAAGPDRQQTECRLGRSLDDRPNDILVSSVCPAFCLFGLFSVFLVILAPVEVTTMRFKAVVFARRQSHPAFYFKNCG